ncbi:sulfurtransferase [Desulfoplanes formicivorans]|uniref:Rhodanese domain-containing protein n=1 Tax=Desulfoplanes formicivorans TaxID=1592317 RepID=A0A194AI20_9BACT|nr:rhodanese-like domain-containing protein [Desulfoplanes formicivorans]GAU09727.1 rhodanese domain-containing protein [Desulfoplanes formicivorans]
MKKKTCMLIAGVAIAALLAFMAKTKWGDSNAPHQTGPVEIPEFVTQGDIFITPDELYAKLGSKDIVILDASHPRGYAKGHIPGAISIGFKGLSDCTGKPGDKGWGTILPKEKLKAKLESLGVDNTKTVVAYSDIFKGPGGGGRAVWQMKLAGFENARLLYGGLAMWKQKGYPLSTTRTTPVPATGLVLKDYDTSFQADQAYVYDNLDTLKIVDVRSLKEYTGEDTSRGEARGGHIAGSKWLEWTALLTPDAGVKSAQEIKQIMAGVGIHPEDDFVLY